MTSLETRGGGGRTANWFSSEQQTYLLTRRETVTDVQCPSLIFTRTYSTHEEDRSSLYRVPNDGIVLSRRCVPHRGKGLPWVTKRRKSTVSSTYTHHSAFRDFSQLSRKITIPRCVSVSITSAPRTARLLTPHDSSHRTTAIGRYVLDGHRRNSASNGARHPEYVHLTKGSPSTSLTLCFRRTTGDVTSRTEVRDGGRCRTRDPVPS